MSARSTRSLRSARAFRSIIVAGAAVLAACGGDKAASPSATPAAETKAPEAPAAQPAPTPAPAAPAAPAAAEVTVQPDAQGVVQITSSDQMRYSATRIEVKAGQKVKIQLKNAGSLAKEVMGHDLVVLKAGTDAMVFGAKAAGAKATDFIPTDAPEMIAHTKLLGPGEADTIEFDLPGAGSYPFLCTFPGHVALMKGVLVAQ